jgi:hypothetical protein
MVALGVLVDLSSHANSYANRQQASLVYGRA